MRKLIAACVAVSLAGCVSIPENLLATSPKSLERRQIEARKFTGIQETNLVSAVGAVIQDLGFTLEGSETKLGLIVAQKDRDATQAGEVVAAVLIALLGGGQTAISRDQIRKFVCPWWSFRLPIKPKTRGRCGQLFSGL